MDRKNKQIIFLVLKYFLSITILVPIIYLILKNKETILSLKDINIFGVLLLLLSSILAYLPTSLEFNISLKLFNIPISYIESFKLSSLNSMYNYFIPIRGGSFARAYLLKKRYGLDYSKYLSLLGGLYFIGIFVSSLIALLTLNILLLFLHMWYCKLYFLSLFLFLTLIVLFFLLNKIKTIQSQNHRNKVIKALIKIYVGLSLFKKNPKVIVKISLVQIILVLFLTLRLYISFILLDISVSFIHLLVVQSLVTFSTILSITPGNIGIREGIVGLLSNLFGISLPGAFMAAALDRVVSMCVVFLFGFISHLNILHQDQKEHNMKFTKH
ncbi:lysylphosphatidylglycerol synthase transmembrane domain-containing protein [Fidelibacter multiformis]|uniref:lysylphosphatidylglycerol synthase transmembrane domain-containing protein n=1 Tax=Fidelibacter multiformis TaxID=3377529 RepID=UPI0037DC3304